MGRVSVTRDLTPEEERFAEWARGRGDDVLVAFEHFAPEGEEPWESVTFGIETITNGVMHTTMRELDERDLWPEHWEHLESVMRAAAEQCAEQRSAAYVERSKAHGA